MPAARAGEGITAHDFAQNKQNKQTCGAAMV